MRKRLLLVSLGILATASVLFAGRTGVVRTGEGEVYEGEITENADEIIVRTHGVDTAITRDRVASIDYTSYADRFKDALARLADDDVAGRVALSRDAFNRHEYESAQVAINSALEIDPLNRDAREFESIINSQIQLEARAGTTRPAEAIEEASDVSATTRPMRRYKGLNDDQANRIRQLELRADDTVRVQFRDNVRKRFVDSQPGMAYHAFAARADVDQAMTIIAKGKPDMVDDVIIRNDPHSVQAFGRRIQTALVQGCASSNCHGGPHAGQFRLLTGAPDASTMITNFYLVTQYAQKLEQEKDNIFSPPSLPLVDRGNATKSLLYQYSLPRARATHKHPAVRGWDGLFRDDNDRLARDMVQWMDVDLARFKPDYGFTYVFHDPRSPTSEPSTEPSAESTTLPSTESSAADPEVRS